MRLSRHIVALSTIAFAVLTGTSCVSTSSNSFGLASQMPATQDRSSPVFRKDSPAVAEISEGVEVQALTNVKKSLFSFMKGAEPEIQHVSDDIPATKPKRSLPSLVGANLLVRTTAYCHKELDSLPYGRLSAAGGQLQYGSTIRSAAADWSRFPMGTRFRIEGQPYEYVIDDYGSALVGTNTIDIYKPSIAAMNEWGVRRLPIQIIEWGCFHKSREILSGRKHVKNADHVRQMLRDIETRYISNYSTAGVNSMKLPTQA